MNWDDLTEEQRHAAVTAVAQVENGAGKCFCHGCMAVCEAMAKAVVESLPSPTAEMVPWEPRDVWPTDVQVEAWQSDGRRGWLSLRGSGLFHLSYGPDGAMRWIWWRGVGMALRSTDYPHGPQALIPTREGRPVSWSEVDAAVKATEVK